jgi:amino acid adenylation domain-containing protein
MMKSSKTEEPGRPRDENKSFPLSYGQRAVWYMQHLFPDSPVYNLQSTWRIVSDLDIPALRRTFQWLVDRHEMLRTTFHLEGREPIQTVHPKQDVFFRIHDAAEWAEDDFRAQVDREAERPFDLEKGPLMRVHLFLREPGRHLFLTSFHHIIADLWSMTLIYQELQRLYPAAKEGRKAPPFPAKAYSDYVRWQSDMLRGPTGDELWEYWRTRFEGGLEQLVLPTDRPRSPSPNFEGSSFPFKLDSDLTRRLHILAANSQSTLFTVLLAGFEALLHLTTGQELFLIRSLAVGRSRAEWEPIVGFFANPFVLQVNFTGAPTFAETVARVQRAVTEAIERQDFPFEHLMEKIRFGQRFSFNPMSEVMFILQTPQRFLMERKGQTCTLEDGMFAPGDTGVRVDFGGLLVEKFNPGTRTTLNDLDLQTVEIGGEVSGVFNYRSDLFLPATMAGMSEDFGRLLAWIVENPDRPVRSFAGQLGTRGGFRPKAGPPPEPRPTPPADRRPRLPAADGVERSLVEMLTETMGIGGFDLDSRFFEIGGTSLQALQLTILAREKFQVELPIRRLFENPTIAELAVLIRDSAGNGRPPLLPAGRDEGIPLSFPQERLWFLDRLSGGSPFYNIPVAVRIRGSLDTRALEKSFNEIIKRHTILRTTYGLIDGIPAQNVRPSMSVKIAVEDIGGSLENDPSPEILAKMSGLSLIPFDLENGPPIRITLFRLGREDHIALLVIHHIAADAWSFGVLLRELASFYGAFTGAGAVSLPELRIQYADYALWQRRMAERGWLQDQLQYWKKALNGAPVLDLPTDKLRPAVQTYPGGAWTLGLSAELVASLKRLSIREGVTAFMTYLASFLAVLCRWTGAEDIVVGTPTAGRVQAEIEPLIGCFLNLLPLRTNLSGDPSFRHLLARVRETALGAFANQELPFEKLVQELRPRRDLGREPLFQVMFALQNAPMPELRLPGGTELRPVDLPHEVTRYDLTLFLTETGDSVSGCIEYNRDLFLPGTIERLAGYFQSWLAAAVANPELRLSELPLMRGEERNSIVAGRNRTKREYPEDLPAHQMFEARARESPENDAVVWEDRVMNYGELNARAEKIGRLLSEKGAGPEKVVAVCMERIPLLPAAILGVLKTGAAFLPLDPQWPGERLSYMLADARALCVLSAGGVSGRLAGLGLPVIALEETDVPPSAQPDHRPIPVFHPDSLAYVIYTSGSSGRPKGVMVPHRALANYLFWCADKYRLGEGRGVLFHSSIAYDFAVTLLLAPLAAGQKIIISPSSAAGPSSEFLARAAHDLTLMKLTPSHAKMIGRIMGPDRLAGAARTLVLGGEGLHAPQIADWLDHAGRTAIYNEYGPTEATVGCCVHRASKRSKVVDNIPIGRPIANTRIYILDRFLQPVPPGWIGEIYIGGAGLARGYLGRPDLTAESFIPDPFSNEPGARIYRSGDLARRLPDGEIEFLGRIDSQVKVRGFRVEPGEVESVLSHFPDVRQAAVIAERDPAAGAVLRAYIEINPSEDEDPSPAIREFLRRRLPDYMIPASFVFLDKLPLLENGKIDRRTLPKMQGLIVRGRDDRVLASTPVEKEIARIFAAALGIHDVEIHGDFFELGGHSLLAVQVETELRKSFPGRAFDLLNIFENPTVARLAEFMEKEHGTGENRCVGGFEDSPSIVVLKPGGSGIPLFFLHPAGGDVLAYRHLVSGLQTDGPVYGIRSKALSDPLCEFDSIRDMAEKYAELVRHTRGRGPYRLAGWSFGAAVAIAVAEALETKGEAVDFVGLLDPPDPPPNAEMARIRLHQHIEHALRSWPDSGPITPEKTGSLLRLYDSLSVLPEEERPDRLAEHMVKENLVPSGIPKDRIVDAIRLLEAHEKLLASFRPQKIPDSLNIWKAENDMTLDRATPAEQGACSLSWASRPYSIAGGDHWSMLEPPHVESLARAMNHALADGAPGDSESDDAGKFPGVFDAMIPGPRDDEWTLYRIVFNQEEQFSIWPSRLSIPPGWSEEGTIGAKQECLSRIPGLWTDMRPLSLRRRMAGGA